jgi:glucan phosphoethanolaminetransferase (alkaline phosphatase superfamily)
MNNVNQSSEVKTKNITLGSIIAWIFGLGNALAGIGFIVSNLLVGVLYLLIAIILIPPISRGVQNKLNIRLSSGLKFVIVIVLLVIIGTNMSGSSDIKNNVTSTSNVTTNQTSETSEVAIKVTAAKIIADYKANEVSADAIYKGKLVEISGTVDAIAKDITDTPYITLSSGDPYAFEKVQCMFSNDQESELASISKGQLITLQGRVSGKLMNIVVENCKIVK